MKMRAAAGLAAFLAACLCNTSVMAEAPMPLGDVHIFGGGKIMNKDDWAPADQETEFGGEVDFQPHSWPIALTAAYFSGRGSGAMDPSVAYDAYGNATQVVASTPDGFSKTTTNTYSNDITRWLLGRLTRASVTSVAP